MKICPSCREEFLDHIEICGICDQALMNEEEIRELPCDTDFLSKEELLSEETIPLMEGGIAQCREIEKVLIKSQISCLVYPKSLSCDNHNSTLGTTCDMKYLLLIRPADIEQAKKALEGQFSALVLKEGQGQVFMDTVNLDEDVITCPACGESNQLKDGECPSCGLTLGVSEHS